MFDEDWNQIMDLVDFINKTQNLRQANDTTHSTLKREVQLSLGQANKEVTIKAIKQFLNYYNNEYKS